MLNSTGQHSLLKKNNGSLGSQRFPLRFIENNNFTLRSAKSSNNSYSINCRGIAGIIQKKLKNIHF